MAGTGCCAACTARAPPIAIAGAISWRQGQQSLCRSPRAGAPQPWAGCSPLALSRGVREGPRCPEQLPLWRGPEPYAGKHGVDVSWRAVCVHRRHQDGPAGIRCRGKEQREGNNGSFSPYREAVGFPCSRYGQHSSLQHGLERLEWTGTTTPMAATAQGTLMWDIQNLMGSAQQIHPPHCSLMCLI